MQSKVFLATKGKEGTGNCIKVCAYELNQTFLKRDISQLSPNVTTYQTLQHARTLLNVPICQNK